MSALAAAQPADSPRARVEAAFAQRYGAPPAFVVRAPGRVNLIGEHTDYNDGFVMPLAIDRALWIALRPLAGGQVRAHSLDYNEDMQLDLRNPAHGGPQWSEYIGGTAWALAESGHVLAGWEGVLAGDVPIGAGLSSSAALELATARAFAATGGWQWDAAGMARACQHAENAWVGVNCGIMDQMISAAAVAGHALLIDCRSLAVQAVPLPAQTSVVVLDTSTRRGLVGSAYNERRDQCESAARALGVPALRDASSAQLAAAAQAMEPLALRRARHVVGEDERTLAAVQHMQQGNADALGALLNASHASLRDDFDVSSAALNAIVECAQQQPGCHGARMTGAGFGGCAVALVQSAAAAGFARAASVAFHTATGLTAQIYICRPSAGASIVSA
jgi:galactokinase